VRARNAAARLLRRLPAFRGKGRLGLALHRLLPGGEGPVWVTMRGGWQIQLDLRVPPERFPYWTGAYEDEFVLLSAETLTEGATALDVGANVGLFTIPLALAARTRGARVIAFEPVPANVTRLRASIAANGLGDVVTVLPYALGAEPGTLTLAPEAGEVGGNAARSADGLEVEVRTLDELQDLGDCVFVKIDVEGGELDVLYGGEQFFQRTRPRILLELNQPWMSIAGWSVTDLLELCGRWNYEVNAPELSAIEMAMLEPRDEGDG
jgi:FkbM family methyltransferase